MAHIQLFYRDLLKKEVELESDAITIGRSADSDVQIENAGVSAHHARIIKVGEDFFIEDTGSRNGTFINGKRISRHPLSYGDEVVISKHILKLAALGEQLESPDTPDNDAQQVVQGATVEIDVSNLGKLIKQRHAKYDAYLLLPGATHRRSKYPLSKLNFKIGKARTCDIYTSGWFAPRVAARVVCKSDGFYIVPGNRGRVRVNGISISAPLKLENGDGFAVRGLAMMFYNQPEKQK